MNLKINTGYNKLVTLCVLLVCILPSAAQFYTGSFQEFGKNRVQYQGFKWQSYDFERFKVYFNGDGKNLAVYTARSAHLQLQELEDYVDLAVTDKLEIIVYNKQSDFRQSNIGITDDINTNIGGVTRLVGNRLFVYFNGNHNDFDKEIRCGLAQVVVAHIVHGQGWKDVVKNATSSSLPDWFIQGYIRYLAYGWDSDIDDRVKDALQSGKFHEFNHLEGAEAALAGHALWNYIAEKFGDKVVPNVFYIGKASRNLENGFYLVLNMSMITLANDFIRYYRERYKLDDANTLEPDEKVIPLKTRKKAELYGFRLSADGSRGAVVENTEGRYRLLVFDTETGKKKKIYSAEFRSERPADLSFPVIAWHPKLDALAFVTERKGEILLKIYSFDDGKTNTIPLSRLTKVLYMNYSSDGKQIVMSAVADGKSDIYLYQIIGNTHKQLTDDRFDDLYPVFEKGTGKIIFSSNRPNDTIPRNEKAEMFKPVDSKLDLFELNPSGPGGRVLLKRLTNTPSENEMRPFSSGNKGYMYVTDANGIWNRKIAYYDSAISYIDTAIHYRYFTRDAVYSDYNRNARDFHVNAGGSQYGFIHLKEGKYHLYKAELSGNKEIAPDQIQVTEYKRLLLGVKKSTTLNSATGNTIKVPKDTASTPEEEIDIDRYQFYNEDEEETTYQKEVINLEEQIEKAAADKKEKKKEEFTLPLQTLYKKNFAVDYVVTQIDNNFLNASYQRYVGPGAIYFNPGINGLMRVGMTEVFEDWKIAAGFRLGVDFKSGEYLLQIDNLTNRVDHRFIAFRQSAYNELGNYVTKVKTTELRYQARLPFTETLALRGTAGYRNDLQVIQAIDNRSLDAENELFHLASAKMELIFDNTISRGLNLYNGSRMKLFGEYYRELNADKANMFVVGLDVRHYQKIHKEIIWATRISAGTSFGDKLLLHYLGGVDNWILRRNPSFDSNVLVSPDHNYAFQTIATPMRGFIQNARNGNSFALINTELRIPLVRYFTNRPISSEFWYHFQLVGFFDIGTAWTGAHPYASSNSFNQTVVNQKPLVITIQNQKEPIIWGYGLGLRTKVFGYFTRFDWAWGVDDYEKLPSIRYLSFTLDF